MWRNAAARRLQGFKNSSAAFGVCDATLFIAVALFQRILPPARPLIFFALPRPAATYRVLTRPDAPCRATMRLKSEDATLFCPDFLPGFCSDAETIL
jgi:hypothetical protein